MLEALALASALTASGADRCSEPPRIASGVAALHGQVAEAESLTHAEIQDMARRSNAVLAHPPLGLYVAHFAYDVQAHTETEASGDGTRCGMLTTVTVRLALLDRAVMVARDLRERGCDHDAVMRHYMKHALADDRALSRYVAILQQALVAAWPGILERLSPSGVPDPAELRKAMEPVVTAVADAANRERMTEIADVDSDAEVRALASACAVGR